MVNYSTTHVKLASLGFFTVILASSVSFPVQAVNFVTNGSFEQNGNVGQLVDNISTAPGWTVGPTVISGNTPPGTKPFAFTVDANADSTGFPSVFTPTAGTNIFIWGPGRGENNGFTGSPNGGKFLGVDGDYAKAPVYQSISGLTPGQDYIVSFEYALAQFTDATGPITGGWEVTFGSTQINTPVLSNPSKGFSGWKNFSQTFTATDSTQTLNFLAYGAPVGQPPFSLLDGVEVTPVPEPVSVLGSFVALGFMSRFSKLKNKNKK